jgi:hypothetical protein
MRFTRLCALGFAIACLGACGGDPTASTPEKVFADGFLNPLEEVSIEAEGGTVVRGYDAWLKILPQFALNPRYADQYQPIDCQAPRVYFSRVLRSDELAPTHARLECLGASDARFSFDNGRWLIYKVTDGRYYFRVWKHN